MLPEILCLLLFIGTFALLLLGFPVAFSLAGSALFFAGVGALLGIFDVAFLTAFPQRIFSIMSNQVLVAVPLFVFMGVMLERSKIAEDLLESLGRLFGGVPGGLAYSVTIVGALLAASSGIVGATVVTMGLLSLPTMLKYGYSPRFATGTIATSGTLGQIIPPSIVLVLLGDQLSSAYQTAQFKMGRFSADTVSVNDLFVGALIPGLMLVTMYLVYQFVFAYLRPDQAPPLPVVSDEKTSFRTLAQALFAPLILIVAVLGSILSGLASPTEVASVGAVGAIMLAGYKLAPGKGRLILLAVGAYLALLLISWATERLKSDDIMTGAQISIFGLAVLLAALMCAGIFAAVYRVWQARLEDGQSILKSGMGSTLRVTTMVFVILIGASMFSLVFRGFGGDEMVHAVLQNMPGGTVGAVLLVMLLMFFLGFFLDFLEITFIVVPIVAPILLQMEISPGVPMSPVWLGIMMAVNLQMSFLTPPFGFSLFYLRGVAPESVKTSDIYRGIVPYVGIQLFALVILWFFPVLSTALPNMIYGQ